MISFGPNPEISHTLTQNSQRKILNFIDSNLPIQFFRGIIIIDDNKIEKVIGVKNMGKTDLSYTEAYTDFLKYYSKKESITMEMAINKLKSNGAEQEFREWYSKYKFTNAEYYNRIRGR